MGEEMSRRQFLSYNVTGTHYMLTVQFTRMHGTLVCANCFSGCPRTVLCNAHMGVFHVSVEGKQLRFFTIKTDSKGEQTP